MEDGGAAADHRRPTEGIDWSTENFFSQIESTAARMGGHGGRSVVLLLQREDEEGAVEVTELHNEFHSNQASIH